MRAPNKEVRTLEERVYDLLLALYPRQFRREYGIAMRQTFRDMLEDNEIGKSKVWRRVVSDVAASLVPEHIASFRRGQAPSSYYGLFLGLALAVAIVLTNVADPSFSNFGLSDTIAMGLSGALLLAYLVASGLIAAQGRASIARGAGVGALTALLGMGMAILTFAAVDNLFIDIVSKQPDKIWGFAHSNYPSMDAYIRASSLRGFLILPLFVVLGTACGTAGAAARKFAGGMFRR